MKLGIIGEFRTEREPERPREKFEPVVPKEHYLGFVERSEASLRRVQSVWLEDEL